MRAYGLTSTLLALVAPLGLAVCGGNGPVIEATPAATTAATPGTYAATPAMPLAGDLAPVGASNIARVWANEGGDKVTQDELRATSDPAMVGNSVWDGTGISLFGARNEVVSFNLVLEAPRSAATVINVTLHVLTGPQGARITTRPASGDGVFDYVGRNIELFYVRYLEIKGLSTDLFYDGVAYDERHIPERCRRPFDADFQGIGGWTDRPCHNKFYPDIAVPLELESPFAIRAGTNQSIWGDIYIPKTVPSGEYRGTISVTEDGALTWQIPIRLRVRDFTLPDVPGAKTMLVFGHEDITDRYLGEASVYPEPGTAAYTQTLALIDRHFQLAHRHKISLIGDLNDYTPIERMEDAWTSRLSGELFTPARGYDGVGVGAGNNVYSIGTYGSWPWQGGTQTDMQTSTDAWVSWFDDQVFAPASEYFLYLEDEPDPERYLDVQRWAEWIDNDPGPGSRLKSFVTLPLPDAVAELPALDIIASLSGYGITASWDGALDALRANPEKRFFVYNGVRPATGSFGIEDDGVALRTIAWAQYKKGIDRWFYWQSTYYNNFQGNTGQTNVFQTAQTYGDLEGPDDALGQTGDNYLNGDGVLFYPGTDTRYPDDSYGVQGPFASLRLKHWRRGIQDADYLALAAAIDPARTARIVDSIIPKVLWEYGVTDPNDPTYLQTDISWSTVPDVWEAARAELADIIEGGSGVSGPAPPAECPPGSECVLLAAGSCQFVAWTGGGITSPGELATAVRPTENLRSIWAQQPPPIWKGYDPRVPGVSDLEPLKLLDIVAICMAGPGDFARSVV
jgi:hypothetical protein